MSGHLTPGPYKTSDGVWCVVYDGNEPDEDGMVWTQPELGGLMKWDLSGLTPSDTWPTWWPFPTVGTLPDDALKLLTDFRGYFDGQNSQSARRDLEAVDAVLDKYAPEPPPVPQVGDFYKRKGWTHELLVQMPSGAWATKAQHGDGEWIGGTMTDPQIFTPCERPEEWPL